MAAGRCWLAMRATGQSLWAAFLLRGQRPGYRGPPKGRPLGSSELRRFYAALRAPHAKRFFLLGLGTAGRPDAIVTLEWPQINLPARSIRLNAPGRSQTNKRRAEVPICDLLARHLRSWGEEEGWEGALIRFRGQAVGSVKTCWRKARVRAGVDCSPYSLRHTVGKWLRSQSVPPWEVAALLGHKMPGFSITEMFASADPSHMKATRAALDALLRAVCVPPISVSGPRHR